MIKTPAPLPTLRLVRTPRWARILFWALIVWGVASAAVMIAAIRGSQPGDPASHGVISEAERALSFGTEGDVVEALRQLRGARQADVIAELLVRTALSGQPEEERPLLEEARRLLSSSTATRTPNARTARELLAVVSGDNAPSDPGPPESPRVLVAQTKRMAPEDADRVLAEWDHVIRRERLRRQAELHPVAALADYQNGCVHDLELGLEGMALAIRQDQIGTPFRSGLIDCLSGHLRTAAHNLDQGRIHLMLGVLGLQASVAERAKALDHLREARGLLSPATAEIITGLLDPGTRRLKGGCFLTRSGDRTCVVVTPRLISVGER